MSFVLSSQATAQLPSGNAVVSVPEFLRFQKSRQLSAADSVDDRVLITVIETAIPLPRQRRPRLILTKRRGPGADDEQTYDKAEYFLFHAVPVGDARELFILLCSLAGIPYAAIIRGAPLPGLDLSRPQRRLIYRHGDAAPTVAAGQAIWWAAFDLDKSALPEGVDWRTHPREAAWEIVRRDLPSWVTEADIVVYWSSSQGFKPHMKIRVFVLLARPLTSSELRALMKPLVESEACPVDLALYSDVQLHYTATPLLTGCVTDPLPDGRHYLFEGARRRAVPPPMPTASVPSSGRTAGSAGGPVFQVRSKWASHRRHTLGGRGGSANVRITAEIECMGDGEGKCGFHMPWNSALAIFYAQNGPDADPRPLIAKLRRRIVECGTRDAGYIERETRGMVGRARVLAAREREKRDTSAALRAAAGDVIPSLSNKEKAR